MVLMWFVKKSLLLSRGRENRQPKFKGVTTPTPESSARCRWRLRRLGLGTQSGFGHRPLTFFRMFQASVLIAAKRYLEPLPDFPRRLPRSAASRRLSFPLNPIRISAPTRSLHSPAIYNVRTVDAKILGRKTFDLSARMGANFSANDVHYVFSRQSPPPSVPIGVRFVTQLIGAFAKQMRAQPGKNIWMMGGGGTRNDAGIRALCYQNSAVIHHKHAALGSCR
jgi:hypothetical protein